MTQIVGIDRRDMGQGDRDDVEQAAVEVEVLEGEEIARRKSAAVVRNDQFAVVMLHAFIIGDRVVPEREQRGDGESQKKAAGQETITLGGRERPNEPSRRPVPPCPDGAALHPGLCLNRRWPKFEIHVGAIMAVASSARSQQGPWRARARSSPICTR